MSNEAIENTVRWFLTLLACFSFLIGGLMLGFMQGCAEVRIEAVKAGVAYYAVNTDGRLPEFRWKQPSEKETR